MFVQPVSHQWQRIRWFEIVALALALTALFATAVGAGERESPLVKPGPLPQGINEWSKPMDSNPPVAMRRDVGYELWAILGMHAEGKYAEAIRAWNALAMPDDANFWQCVALAQAYLAESRLDEAEEVLGTADELRPDNSAVHYFLGILRLEQAHRAREWPDAMGPVTTRLVAFAPRRVVPNSRSMYELSATMEFEKAIAHAHEVWLDEPLVLGHIATSVALEPTVGDLLLAVGADRWEGKAHQALSHLFLERGALELAEHHLDAAIKREMTLIGGYEELADAYESRGQYSESARVRAKSSSQRLNTLRD